VNTLRVLSPWTQVGTTRAGKPMYRPQVLLDHPLGIGESCLTATGKAIGAAVPSPNVHVAELLVSDATLAAIQADARYAGGILWVNDGSAVPTASQYSNLSSFLNTKYGAVPAGVSSTNTQTQNEAAITSWTQTLAAVVTIG
jgi:hypothetical protein